MKNPTHYTSLQH